MFDDFLLDFLGEFNRLKARVKELEERERSTQTLILKDGITAPSAVAGLAIVFVDTADGDLKIIFGDSTTKTIIADT